MNKKLEVLQENLETLLLDKTEAYTRGLNYGLSSKIVPNWNEHTRPEDRLWPPA